MAYNKNTTKMKKGLNIDGNVTVYFNKFETTKEKWYAFSLRISKKELNDEYISTFINLSFSKGCKDIIDLKVNNALVNGENKFDLFIRDGWLSLYKDGDKPIIFVNDCE